MKTHKEAIKLKDLHHSTILKPDGCEITDDSVIYYWKLNLFNPLTYLFLLIVTIEYFCKAAYNAVKEVSREYKRFFIENHHVVERKLTYEEADYKTKE